MSNESEISLEITIVSSETSIPLSSVITPLLAHAGIHSWRTYTPNGYSHAAKLAACAWSSDENYRASVAFR